MSRPSNCNNQSSLASFPGLVSHDRELISSLATRIIELTPDDIVDYHGSYEEYLERQGIA